MKYSLLLLIGLYCNINLSAQTVINMEKSGGVYYIPCEVNGLRLKFIFDTGASDVSISMAEALFMLKNGYLNESDIKGTNRYQTASGSIEEGTNIILRKIKVGDQYLYDVEASIVNSINAPLLLGQSALSKLGNISMDYSMNQLIIGEKPISRSNSEPKPPQSEEYFSSSAQSNSNYGRVDCIRIGNLDVMPEDSGGMMTWRDAKKACESIGNGWRLPTKKELNILYENKEKIGGFENGYYWSSTENYVNNIWIQNFGFGLQQGNIATSTNRARAVRPR